MSTTMPNKKATGLLNLPDEIEPLHATGSSATWRTPGTFPAVLLPRKRLTGPSPRRSGSVRAGGRFALHSVPEQATGVQSSALSVGR